MKKHAFRLVQIFCILLLIFAAVLFGTSLTLQSSWGKAKVHQWIQTVAKKNNATIEISNLSGALPFTWNMDRLHLRLEDNFDITCKNVSFRISLFALLKQELSFRSLHIHTCTYHSLESNKPKENVQEFVDYTKEMKIGVRVKPLKIENLYVNDALQPQEVKGKFYLAKGGEYISFKWIVHFKEQDISSVILSARGSPARGIRGSIQFDNYFLKNPTTLPIDGKIHAHSTWKGFMGLLLPCPSNEALKGRFFLKAPISKDPIDIEGKFSYKHKQFLNIRDFKIFNNWLAADGNVLLSPDFHLQKGKMHLQFHSLSDSFSQIDGSGNLQLNLSSDAEKNLEYSIKMKIPKLTYRELALSDYQVQSSGTFHQQKLNGWIEGQFVVNDLEHRVLGNIDYTKEQGFQIPYLSIASSNSTFESHLKITSDLTLLGDTQFKIKDFNSWFVAFPDANIYGSVGGTVYYNELSGKQKIDIEAIIENFRYESFWSRYIDMQANIVDVSFNPKGSISAFFQDANFWGMDLTSLYAYTSNTIENWPFILRSEGLWKSPFSFNSTGFWRVDENLSLLNIQEFSGYFFEHSFDMPEPFQLVAQKDLIDTQPLLITLENSELRFQANLSENGSNINLTMDHFPLDFLSFNPLDVDIGGYASTRFHLEENSSTEAELNVSLEEFNLWAMDEQLPFTCTGQVHANLKNEVLHLFSDLQSNDVNMLKMDGKVPLKLHLMPFAYQLKKKDPVAMNLRFDGPLEQILDFINIGPQRLEGDLICDIHLSETLYKPKVQGVCQIQNGFYENYFTGMILENIFARAVADEKQIILQSLSASDPVEGKFSATGVMQLNPNKHFPYIMKMKLDDLEIIRLNSLTTYARGNLELEGNTKGASAKGKISVREANFSIPGKITRDLPSLDVTYIPEKLAPQPIESVLSKTSYPIDLDLKLSAPSTITVSGRGVNSKWKGDVELKGEYPNDILAKGRLDMVRGEFVFSGKMFDLSEGELVFNEKKAPFLNLTGSVTEQGILIIANLKGDLTQPKLTFRSSPPLPLSSILSYLIFGQDLSEISGLQAIQLASAVAAISGEGPDYLEETRRSLGVDRLAIINQPTGDGQSISVQVGKYITKNVLVSVSQGAQQNSTNVTVEVDLKKGLIFQAETQQQQVQGKFTLKWNQNF